MKATGEVMGIGATLEECFLKSVRSLETGVCHFRLAKFDDVPAEELLTYLAEFHDDNIYAIAELLRRGESVERIHAVTAITELFLESLQRITRMEQRLAAAPQDADVLREAKIMGFFRPLRRGAVERRGAGRLQSAQSRGITPVFRMVDTLHTGTYIAYLYSSYTGTNESRLTDKRKIVVLGAGPIRIGQGVEFDYSTVHAVQTIRRAGYEAIIINNNPETVSTDYTTSDKLYFEPLTVEDVMAILDYEQPDGVIASLGGQTAINLAEPLARAACASSAPTAPPLSAPRTASASRRSCSSWRSRSRRAAPSRTSKTASAPRPRSATLCSCARALCSAAARWRSSRTRRCCATTSRPPWRSTPTSPCSSTTTFRARRSRSTPSATAATCSSPASWSSSSARASTRATPSASIRPTPSPTA